MHSSYTDPNRGVGTQSEVPSISINNDIIRVDGYQKFTFNIKNKILSFNGKKNKFEYISKLLSNLRNSYKCNSFIDLGCSAGLSSLIALNSGYDDIASFDHDPEYIELITTIKKYIDIPEIKESVFSFGEPISRKYDVVFCGALIHWVYSLTADFRNFDDILKYLVNITDKILVIEWVDPSDIAIQSFNHINKNANSNDEEYCTANFEKALLKYGTIISKEAADGPSRIIYTVQK